MDALICLLIYELVWYIQLPLIGSRLEAPLGQLLKSQKAKLHGKDGTESAEGGSILASLFEKLVLVMVVYFLVSIVNSLAQNYHQRLQKQKQTSKNLRKSQATVKQAWCLIKHLLDSKLTGTSILFVRSGCICVLLCSSLVSSPYISIPLHSHWVPMLC